MRIVAVIPARGGSVGLPGKNIRPFNNIPLVGRAIRAARASQYVTEVYVSSDSDEILAVATQFGAGSIRRPQEISGATATSESALAHALSVLQGGDASPVEILVFLQCTSPFTTSEHIDRVVLPLVDGEANSAFSAVDDHGFIWQVGEDGTAVGITHDHMLPRQRRQDMTPRYRESGAIYAMMVNDFLASNNRFCGKTVLVPVKSPNVEIDTNDDWLVAEAYAKYRDPDFTAGAPFSPIKALITDFDGVHTDDSVFVHQDGSESVRCSRSDGMGIEILRNAGLKLLILSREQNSVVSMRAGKLKMEVMHHIHDKLPALDAWRIKNNLEWSDVGYIGNDINDVQCMGVCGMSFAPRDAHEEAKAVAGLVLTRPGGNGAIRELAEYLISNHLIG
jgi:YrbI family 3-deoxy-D-manno-octulosonate 8-phosphate phosphatase